MPPSPLSERASLLLSSWPTRGIADFAENETEISLFNREAYDHFKLNPEVCLSPCLSCRHELMIDQVGLASHHPPESTDFLFHNSFTRIALIPRMHHPASELLGSEFAELQPLACYTLYYLFPHRTPRTIE